jgi:plastocyanin
VALWSVALAVAILAAATGLAQSPMHSMAAVARGHATAPRAAAGTVTRLHQRVVHVTIAGFSFKPARLVVSPGTRIVWTNKDGDPHTVDSARGVWSSDALDTGDQFARVFKQAGTFAYYCSIHPFMHGTIVVKQ